MLRLQENILVFYTGITRSASTVLKSQQAGVAAQVSKQKMLGRMVELARDLKTELEKNNLDAFGEIIHANWELKKGLAREISTNVIDHWYSKARANGALGGKLLGAGTGGFLMFYGPRERHEAIAKALSKLRRIDFRFEPQGSKIIFVHNE